MRKVSEPAGDTLQKALRASTLGQPGAKPFHIRVEIGQTKGAPGDYKAQIEETWTSPTQWVRIVTASHVNEKIIADSSGLHIVAQGDYLPTWLRNFVTAVFTPAPDPPRWYLANAPIEHVELPNGAHSSHCQHSEFKLGDLAAEQVNFANNCFRPTDGLLEMAQSPDYTMEFSNYASYGKLRVARTFTEHPSSGLEVMGKVTALEMIDDPHQELFTVSPEATSSDPFQTITLTGATMLKVAGGIPSLHWPTNIPGHGMFTAWVCLDRTGRVREAYELNSDESGLAADIISQLVGLQWKPVTQQGVRVQAQGPVVFAYPLMQSSGSEPK